MKEKTTLNIVGKVICTNEEENTWGILTHKVNGLPKRILLIYSISERDEVKKEYCDTELSTIVVGLEIILNKCGLEKTFQKNEDIEITIKY